MPCARKATTILLVLRLHPLCLRCQHLDFCLIFFLFGSLLSMIPKNGGQPFSGPKIFCYVVMLCYVVLCFVILCYVMLCCIMLCSVMLCYLKLCYLVLCDVVLCCVMLCDVFFCYVMLCYVVLCFVMLCYIMSCCVVLCLDPETAEPKAEAVVGPAEPASWFFLGHIFLLIWHVPSIITKDGVNFLGT